LLFYERSRSAVFRARAQTLERHRDGVWAHIDTKLTNGLMEAINGLLQLATRFARNFHYFRLAAYLKVGALNVQTPRLLPT
jgi:transposase